MTEYSQELNGNEITENLGKIVDEEYVYIPADGVICYWKTVQRSKSSMSMCTLLSFSFWSKYSVLNSLNRRERKWI